MPNPKKRTLVKDTACPHCGVLFAKNNLAMHVSAKHGGGSSGPAGKNEERPAQSRSETPGAAPPKKSWDVMDPSSW